MIDKKNIIQEMISLEIEMYRSQYKLYNLLGGTDPIEYVYHRLNYNKNKTTILRLKKAGKYLI